MLACDCPPILRLPKVSSPEAGADCLGEVDEYSERMSFLLPLDTGAEEPVGEVGAACQSRSNSPPPPPVLVLSGLLLAAIGDLAAETGEPIVARAAPPLDAAGGSSKSEAELRGLEILVVAGPGPISPPRRSIALGAGALLLDVVEEEIEGAAAAAAVLDEAAGADIDEPFSSSVLGSDGTGPSFAHLFISYLLRIKLSTL